jgi:hypothetical protein
MNMIIMKNMNRIKILSVLTAGLVTFAGCEDPEFAKPAPNTDPITFTANAMFVNASPDAPSLDLHVNGLKIGESVTAGNPQAAYTTFPLTGIFYAAGSTTAGANTSLRAVGSTGDIGGLLDGSDLIYRAGNANVNNLVAANGSRYTLFALDSIDRPKPIRTLNASNFADTTFFNPLTGAYISRVEKAALPAAQRAKVVAIGVPPLGSTDPGGLRFLFLTETYLAFPGGNVTQSQIRFFNFSPNSGNLYIRLKPAAGANIPAVPPALPYVLSFPGFTPSVGSRTTTQAFTLQTTATAGTPIDYNIEVATDATFTNIVHTSAVMQFDDGKIYTVYARGFKGAITAGVVTHN